MNYDWDTTSDQNCTRGVLVQHTVHDQVWRAARKDETTSVLANAFCQLPLDKTHHRTDVLPITNRTQAAGRAKNAVTFVPGDIDFKLVEARDQIRLPCEFGANLFSGSWDISYTNIKTTDWRRQKQNLPQFTAWSNKATNGNNKTS